MLSSNQASYLDAIPLKTLETYVDERKSKLYNTKRKTTCIAEHCQKVVDGDKTINAKKCFGCNNLLVVNT